MIISDYEELVQLRILVAAQKQKIEEQATALEKQHLLIENLTQAILHARKKMFGRSSEVTQVDGQITLFPEAEQLAQEMAADLKDIIVPSHKRKARQPGVRADMIAGLPIEVVKCEAEPDATCPVCDSELVVVGSKVVHTEVVYEPAILKVIQYVQEVYKCTSCGGEKSENPTDIFVEAKTPTPLLAHSLASASVVAWVMYQKYDMGIPLNRQERDWYRLGLVLYRSTMANWVIRCSEEWLLPIYNVIREKMLACELLLGDETRIQCNKEPGKKASSASFMWVMRTGAEESFQAVLFHYSRTRSGDEAKTLYDGFTGYLITDAYAAYGKVDDIIRALCWSHVRRYYIESIPLDARGKELKGSKGAEGREWCNKLFAIERKIAGMEPQEKVKMRQTLSLPVLEGFWSWVDETSAMHTTNTALTKALHYSLNQRKYLETFLKDGRIPISNNLCEAAIRPLANGRKAWLFADSPKGATASAVIFSLVETAKANMLDVYQYLKFLFAKMPDTDFHNNPKLLEEYLPWSPSLPGCCRIQERKKK